jgi:hypothetical protein
MKKKLLSEAQVRRFMGLAGLNPINEMAYKNDDEPMKEAYDMEEELMEEEDEMAGDEMASDDLPDKGGDADVEIEDEKIAKAEEAVETLQDLVSTLSGAMGGEEEPADDMDIDMGDEEEGDEDMDAELEDVDVEPTEDEKEEMEEQIVNEVARRVAKRIVEAKRAHKRMNEALGRSRRRK